MASNRKWKWLILLPVIVLVVSCVANKMVDREIKRVALEQKKVELTNVIDLIALSLDRDNEAEADKYEQNLIDMVQFVDNMYQVYAAVYRADSGEFYTLTGRTATIRPFIPFDHEAFTEAIMAQESGYVTVVFDPGEPEEARDLHLYFRWAPEHFTKEDRYLIVGGVSRYSVTAKTDVLVSIVPIANTLLTFLLMIFAVLLITRLGFVYDLRMGNKWRDKRGGGDV